VGVNFIGGGSTSTKRKIPTCHKIVEVEYGTIAITPSLRHYSVLQDLIPN
jgi:hypothetical protein